MDFISRRFHHGLRASSRNALMTTLCATALLLTAPALAQTQAPITYDIAASDLADALTAFGLQSNSLMTFSARTVEGKQAPALRGAYPPERALEILLRGTGLTYRRAENGAFIISAQAARSSAPVPPSPPPP